MFMKAAMIYIWKIIRFLLTNLQTHITSGLLLGAEGRHLTSISGSGALPDGSYLPNPVQC